MSNAWIWTACFFFFGAERVEGLGWLGMGWEGEGFIGEWKSPDGRLHPRDGVDEITIDLVFYIFGFEYLYLLVTSSCRPLASVRVSCSRSSNY